jgi:uncharacterized protein YchJ
MMPMSDMTRPKILKSPGFTQTEQFLSDLCERTFLKLWSYPNPFRAQGKELCDLIAVFEDRIFLFFDRANGAFKRDNQDVMMSWERWKKEAIDKQIKSARNALRHVRRNRDEIYIDAKCQTKLPINIPRGDVKIHVVIVAHGATEACESFSMKNVSGSLAVAYSDNIAALSTVKQFPFPFMIGLPRDEIVHIFDTLTVQIMLGELDTFKDFALFIEAKEAAIRKYDLLAYAGEEDLLAEYYSNFDDVAKRHFIGVLDPAYQGVIIPEGKWLRFIQSSPYKRKKDADKVSYMWDRLLQKTTQNALDGTLGGDSGIFESRSAVFEMAREPRFSRRALSDQMLKAIMEFPANANDNCRKLSFMPSYFPNTAYVFLQVRFVMSNSYDGEYRTARQAMLEIACGSAKNKFPRLTKIIGIAIDSPKFSGVMNSEDFILLNCDDWPDDERQYYEEKNQVLRFFETGKLEKKRVLNFPEPQKPVKVGRNDRCPCGSGKKFKKCHGA